MELKLHFDHYNINVQNLEKSLEFYRKALGLVKVGEIIAPDNSFIINYLGLPGQAEDAFRLELTWLRDHEGHYDLGENEVHLAFRTDGDYEALREYHRLLGVICFENTEMGIYFIIDPDDYWIEILPPRK